MDFNEYQELANKTDEGKKRTVSIFGLVSEVGSVLSSLKKRFNDASDYPGFQEELSEEIGDTLWYLTSIATKYNLKLEDIAQKNIAKANSFYDSGKVRDFDGKYEEDERFPRQFSIIFSETELKGRVFVKMKMDNCYLGDPLTDNSYNPDDGYRYHDAFHLAYTAILGWSPVIRRQLKRKRKSNPAVDEIEDGARAAIIEEAISLFIFNNAPQRGYFANYESINFSLIKLIKDMCKELEVKECTGKEWKNAIYHGYVIFRKLKENKGGLVSLDLDKRSIVYSES